MHYMMMPLDRHFDLGFGAVADSFKDAADALNISHESALSLNAHLPISFLYRHAIELYFKSAIIIFHRKLKIPYGQNPHDGEPQILVANKWKLMYSVHGLLPLYKYFHDLFITHADYLQTNTGTNWNFPEELPRWISEIEETDSSSTYFRYPVTRHKTKDHEKSSIRSDNHKNMFSALPERKTPLKAFIMLDQNDQIVEAFSHDSTRHSAFISILSNVAQLLHDCHAALVGELTDGT